MKRVNEMTLAKSLVPMIFIEMKFQDFIQGEEMAKRQILAAAIFKTLYRIDESLTSIGDLEEHLYSNIEYMAARNRDKVKGMRGSDINLDDTIKFMKDARYITNLGDVYFTTEKFQELTYRVNGRAPLAKGEERRVPYIKDEVSVPSDLMKEAMDHLGSTEFTVDKGMLDAILAVKEKLPKLAIWKDSASMLAGSVAMEGDTAYTTEIDADSRGRMYNVAHYGPNAQKDDINRSLVKLSKASWITPDSQEFVFMMNEYKDLVGGHPDCAKLLLPEAMVAMYKSRKASLLKVLSSYPTSNPFSVIRLGSELGDVIANNGAWMYMPAGLDAKCSGTQIYSILVGDRELMAACGFSSTKVADPYEMVAVRLGEVRQTVKRPYMVVQYGGGLDALMGDKDTAALYPDIVMRKYICKRMFAAIEDVLGQWILNLREMLQIRVEEICDERNVESFEYSHIDGFVVNKVVCGKIDVTEKYSSIRYQQVDGVIDFGSEKDNTGILNISDRKPSRSEFARTFAVNYIQGMDALIARKVAVYCKDAGIDGLVSIHDCFRVSPSDVLKLMDIIRQVYVDVFVDHDPLKHLFAQLDLEVDGVRMGNETITIEEIYEEGNYFFGQ